MAVNSLDDTISYRLFVQVQLLVLYFARLSLALKAYSVQVKDKILDVPKMWQNETLQQQKLQVLQNDYKHSGYDNDYKINLAISF
jgi:hypothetical protein